MRCTTCHQDANFDPAGVPGHPLWHVAPEGMAWQQRSLRQIASRSRIRGKTAADPGAVQEHMTHDTLVGWAWRPVARASRRPARRSSSAR
jgi:hypothetical protein